MDIDAMSMANAYLNVKQAQFQTQIQTGLLKRTLDDQARSVQNLLGAMPKSQSYPLHLGRNFDAYV